MPETTALKTNTKIKTMKAAVYYTNSDVRIEDVPVPVISSSGGELLVKIEASGICGSDVMEWYRIKKAPIVLGHEIAGTVVECGEGVTKFKIGDRVTVAHHVPCNTCRHCMAGNHGVCEMLRSTTFYPGGFCEYVRIPAVNVDRGVFKLPGDMTFEQGSFSEPLGCVVRGLRACELKPGQGVLVLGSGISGLLNIKLAKALGAGFVVATDVSGYKINAAVEVAGADLALHAKEDIKAALLSKFGRLADIVVLTTPVDSAIAQAIECVERAGTILLFAPKAPGETYPLPLFDLWRDNITIKNTYASPPADTQQAIDLIASGSVTVTDMITHRLGLGEAAKGFSLVAEGGKSMKVIIEPRRGQ